MTLRYLIQDRTPRAEVSLQLKGPKSKTYQLGSQPTGKQRGYKLEADLPDGTYTFTVFARDQAGNKAKQKGTGTLTVRPGGYFGSGDRIIKIRKPTGDPSEPVIVKLSHSGYANFVVWSLDRDLQQTNLLVNTIGNYAGRVALDFEDTETTRLQVQADGSWHVEILSLGDARGFTNSIKGRGDDVVIYNGDAAVANIKHSGSSNFVLWCYSAESSDLLVNEIGGYKGQSIIPDGPAFVVIQADGTWSIAMS